MRRITLLTAITFLLVLTFASAAFGRSVGVPDDRRPPLLQLTKGAETPISLRSAEVQIETTGGFATTTMLLELYNPNNRQLEGTLQFPLSSGQQVAGFALDINGVLRDAVPVPKARARQVFESIERRRVDPGLLEQTAGNHFRLRVYPIPAKGSRRVRVVIEEAMARESDAWRLAIPVHLLSGAENFSLSVQANSVKSAPVVEGNFGALPFKRDANGYQAVVSRSAFRPQGGLSLRFPVNTKSVSYGGEHDGEHYVLAEVPVPQSAASSRAIPTSVGLLWDASASAKTRDRNREFVLLDRYFKAMGNGRVQLRTLRDVGEDVGVFNIRNGDWTTLRSALERVVNDGASNLSDWTRSRRITEYLLVSDGLQNYGDKNFPALAKNQRLYAINSAGATSDSGRLEALAEASGGRLIAWQGRDTFDAAARALLDQGTRIVAMRGEGVTDLQAQTRHVDGGLLRVAGRLTEPTGRIRLTLDDAGQRRDITVDVAAASSGTYVPRQWARWQIAAYSGDPERHRAAIARLGQTFSIVTAGTSLIALEEAADYVRYDIAPPAELRAEVARLQSMSYRQREASRSERLDRVAADFASRLAWWETSFPKTDRAVKKPSRPTDQGRWANAEMDVMEFSEAMPSPPSPPSPARVAGQSGSPVGTPNRPALASKSAPSQASTTATIHLQPWVPDSPYAKRLRAAPANQIYGLYLDERDSHSDSTAFYLDVADLLLEKKRRVEAMRVLSNLAEMDLDSRHVLRVLGYRLMQAGEWKLAVHTFRQVLGMAEEEPQSGRDLALALAADGQRQQAVEKLYEVALGKWDGRFIGIPAIVLNEMNAIIATSPKSLDTAFIDRRLLQNMPLDLRVALSWDSDNSDMDLWVTDPNGEKCYYRNSLTYQGGLISRDFTGGYGPEEFVLRDAKPGVYRVEAHFYGDRQQVVTGATTLTLKLSTGWGMSRQKDSTVTLRLSGKNESVLVGEFEVK